MRDVAFQLDGKQQQSSFVDVSVFLNMAQVIDMWWVTQCYLLFILSLHIFNVQKFEVLH